VGTLGGVRQESDQFDDAVVQAIGKASEGLEYIERARGHLYEFHQLVGRADRLFGEAAVMMDEAGLDDYAKVFEEDIVGRNVLDGRWTFQVVEEFDDLYYSHVVAAVRGVEREHQGGERHVYESRMKDKRRTVGKPGHERRPRDAYSPEVDTDPNP
jgi:hypothetical protein